MEKPSFFQNKTAFRQREQGVLEELTDIASRRMALNRERNGPRNQEQRGRQEFEQRQEDQKIAELALHEGKISIWMEYKQAQEKAKRLSDALEFQRMYTRRELHRKLKTLFGKERAKIHAHWIEEQIKEHPSTLTFLREKGGMRLKGSRLYISLKTARWAAWAGQHRLQLLDLVRQAGALKPMEKTIQERLEGKKWAQMGNRRQMALERKTLKKTAA